MKKLSLVLTLVFFVMGLSMAQRTVTGTLTDATGETLIGASVLVKGTTSGTVTDFDGKYSLAVPADAKTIVYSYTGFESQEIALGTSNVIDVILIEGVTLGTAVVTALNIKRDEKSLGYSLQKVDESAFTTARENNVINSLSGRVAGAQIKTSPGNIGGSSSITLRGINSVFGSNQPLFVVDGTPIDNANHNGGDAGVADSGRDFGNGATDINPDDIESVSILKGAAASALYGSRAINGVILITTKSGKKSNGLSVSVNSGLTVETVSNLPDYQNEYGGGYGLDFDVFAYDAATHPASWASFDGQSMPQYYADESWGPKLDGRMVRHWDSWEEGTSEFGQLRAWEAKPDNIKDFYNTGTTFNNNVAIAGANDLGAFRVSFTNRKQKGVFPNSTLERNAVSLSSNLNVSSKLEVGVKANYINTHGKGRPGLGYGGFGDQVNIQTNFNEWFQRQVDLSRLEEYKNAAGQPRTWNIRGPNDLRANYWESPYWVLNESYEEDRRDRVYGNVYATYKITDDFKISGFARTDFYNFSVDDRLASGSAADVDWFEQMLVKNTENNLELLAQYHKQIGDLSLTAIVGANKLTQSYSRNKTRTSGGLSIPGLYTIAASVDKPVRNDRFSSREIQSVYGSLSLGYKSFLYLDITGRNDWASTLPTEANSFFYPSVSGSFVFSELIDASFLSFGKLRVGYANVGSAPGAYRLGITYTPTDAFGSNPTFAVPNTLNNPDLKPENVASFEVGMDLRLFKNRLGVDVSYYDNSATNQIIPLSVSATTGYTSVYVNAGEITNTGIELSLYGTPVKTSKFSWNTRINYSKNKNLVVSLAEGQDNIRIASWGPSINARVGLPYGTWVTDGYTYDDQDRKVVDEDGFYVRATNQEFGSTQADFSGGFVNDFKFGNVSLGVVIDFQKGGTLYSVTNRYGNYSGVLAATTGTNPKGNDIRLPVADGGGVLAEGVFADGSANDVYVDAQQYFKHLRTRREAYLYDASFTKLREVSLGYSIPSSMLGGGLFKGITISLVGRNLAILTKNAPNIDPETATSNSNVQGFENGQLPSVRSVGVNLSLKF